MKPCIHGQILSRGLRCDRGYLCIRLFTKQGKYFKSCGPHTKEAQILAESHLATKRQEIMLGKFNIESEIVEKKFKEIIDPFIIHWSKERDGDGKLLHDEKAIKECKRTILHDLIPTFGEMYFHLIRTIDINNWREKQIDGIKNPHWNGINLKTEYIKNPLIGTSVNRQMAVLSSIFSKIIRLIQTEKIVPKFKIPLTNPCFNADKAKQRKRERILTEYEAKKLKLSFTTLDDIDGWEICKLALNSVLSLKDLKNLEIGHTIDTERTKTGVPINLPIPVLVSLNWVNFRKRWEAARKDAGLQDFQFRDLRKTGINWLLGQFDIKLISQFAAHANVRTTENSYTIKQEELMKPLAEHLKNRINNI